MTKNIHVSSHPLVAHKISILREKTTPAKQVRELLHEVGQLLMYEATIDLSIKKDGRGEGNVAPFEKARLAESVAYVPVLRSGLSLLDAGLELIPSATVHHLGLYRDSHSLAPIEYYNKLPASPTHSLYIVLDPMVATGGTATAVLAILKDWGVTRVKLVAVCASKKSLESLQNQFPEAQVYVGVVDETLNDQGYVVPGIGDSGDRLYNTPHVE